MAEVIDSGQAGTATATSSEPALEGAAASRRGGLLGQAGLLFLGLVLVGVAWYSSELLWWRAHRDLAVISAARAAGMVVREFVIENDRYPRSVGEVPGLSEAMRDVEAACRIMGRPISQWHLSEETSAHAWEEGAVLTATDLEGHRLVVVYQDGRAGLSRGLLVRAEREIPSWIEQLP